VDLLLAGLWQGVGLIARGDPEVARIGGLSLVVSVTATLFATLVGVPATVALAVGRFPSRVALTLLVNTGMGLPPVVVGLVVVVLIRRTGPLGWLGILYMPVAIIVAQFLIVLPIATGLTRSAILSLDADILHALRIDRAAQFDTLRELVRAALPQVLVAVAAALGRAIAEVGASLIVGGNIPGQTRILTTATTLKTSRGEFTRVIALGIVLLLVALAVNLVLAYVARICHADFPDAPI
jgi:tungstate transport system permease protein